MRLLIFGCAILALAGGCDNNVKSAAEKSKDSADGNKADVLLSHMDSTVSPSQDFFMYTNGGWIKSNPIPGNRGSWTIGHLVIEENQKRIRSIAEKAASSNAAAGTPEQKIGDFYSTAMDSTKIEQLDLAPLQTYLQKINAITHVRSLVAAVSELKKIGSHTLFSDYVTQDDKNSEVMSYKLTQGGIGLPEREYYFKTDSATKSIRAAYLQSSQVKSIDSVIVGQPEFFGALNNLLKSIPIDIWKKQLKYNLIADFSNALPEKYAMTVFNFTKQLSGAKERLPRWQRVIDNQEAVMGEMLGQLYVKEYFNETAKKRYSDMVEAIREALKVRIGQLDWMTDSTKQKAYAKLAAMKKKVGYPDKWKDFSSMQIGKESYVQNLINANSWWHNYRVNKLGKPVDRDEWEMNPQEYNAYYNASNNEIVLPAGIFTVPGYRDEELDDATVYGYAGASTIGHEITHGFDDEGRQYDAQGNLKSWWTKKDEEEFNKRAQVMVKQFNEYEPLKGYHINGKATLGENIADLGGILLGIEAFKKTAQYKEGKKIGGLTPMQRYFMGYALGWMGHIRDEQLRNRLLSDVHSPAKYRVNGPMVDIDEFYTAFNIQPNSPMYRAESLRVKIW